MPENRRGAAAAGLAAALALFAELPGAQAADPDAPQRTPLSVLDRPAVLPFVGLPANALPDTGRLFLSCDGLGTYGNGTRFSLKERILVDLDAATVNGRRAVISPAKIAFSTRTSAGATKRLTVDKRTGAIDATILQPDGGLLSAHGNCRDSSDLRAR